MWRRGLLLGALALPACGFRPLYGSDGRPRNEVVAASPRLTQELAAVRVANIPERSGQLLRRQLQRQLEDRIPGTPSRYDLRASLALGFDVQGIRRDGNPTRLRAIATGTWALSDRSTPPTVVGRGTLRSFDAFNIPDLQAFAADASREDMERRLSAEIADRIVTGVALALRRRLEAEPVTDRAGRHG